MPLPDAFSNSMTALSRRFFRRFYRSRRSIAYPRAS